MKERPLARRASGWAGSLRGHTVGVSLTLFILGVGMAWAGGLGFGLITDACTSDGVGQREWRCGSTRNAEIVSWAIVFAVGILLVVFVVAFLFGLIGAAIRRRRMRRDLGPRLATLEAWQAAGRLTPLEFHKPASELRAAQRAPPGEAARTVGFALAFVGILCLAVGLVGGGLASSALKSCREANCGATSTAVASATSVVILAGIVTTLLGLSLVSYGAADARNAARRLEALEEEAAVLATKAPVRRRRTAS